MTTDPPDSAPQDPVVDKIYADYQKGNKPLRHFIAQAVLKKQERIRKADNQIIAMQEHINELMEQREKYWNQEAQVTALRTALEEMKDRFKWPETVEQKAAIAQADAALASRKEGK